MLDQHLNSNNSNLGLVSGGRFAAGLAIVVALALGAAALTLPPALTGRLHPAAVPGALCALALLSALANLRRFDAAPSESPLGKSHDMVMDASRRVIDAKSMAAAETWSRLS